MNAKGFSELSEGTTNGSVFGLRIACVSTGMNESERADGAPDPTALPAVTEQVYVFEFVSPTITIGLDIPVADPTTPPLLDVHVAL